MPTVIMPKMGDAMEEGTLLRWLKQPGDEVAVGDPIAEIETDKVTLEIEAADGGVLSQTLVAEGAVVPIGTAIATIGEEDGAAVAAGPAETVQIAEAPGETPYEEGAPAGVDGSLEESGRQAAAVAAAPPSAHGAAAPQPQTQAPPRPQPVGAAPVAPAGGGERLRASPLVKRLAAEHGIDLAHVAGSGPGGRIVKDDIAPYLDGKPLPEAAAAPAAQAAAPTPAAPETAPAPVAAAPATGPAGRPAARTSEPSRIKKTTGRRMIESVTTAPHFYVTVEVDMDAAIAFREGANAQIGSGTGSGTGSGAGEDGARVSYNDLVVKAAAMALRAFPNLNASFENDLLHEHPNIDVNIAVALPEGLIAPFVPDADQKSLGAIARMAKDLVGRARSGGLKPEEYQGGTFTVSNLGMFEVDEFISIINPPQAAILAVGSIKQMPVVKDGEIVPGNRMKLTLSADHRVTDGAESARFLGEVKRYLEHPMLLALG